MTEEKKKPNNEQTETKESEKKQKSPLKEIGGREGPDPVRYGDWENNGIASDF